MIPESKSDTHTHTERERDVYFEPLAACSLVAHYHDSEPASSIASMISKQEQQSKNYDLKLAFVWYINIFPTDDVWIYLSMCQYIVVRRSLRS